MKNVNSLFIPTTDYTIKDKNLTSYAMKISVARITYETIDDVLKDIREQILSQLQDNLTPAVERSRKVLTEI